MKRVTRFERPVQYVDGTKKWVVKGVTGEWATAQLPDDRAGRGDGAGVSLQGGGADGAERRVRDPAGQHVGRRGAEEAGTDRGQGPTVARKSEVCDEHHLQGIIG